MATNCPQKTISSDVTGLSYSIEKCLGERADAPVWKPLEPNSIDTMGATLTTGTRTPIGSGRQRIKGEVLDLEAAAGYTSDLTSNNHQDFIKGFLLAEPRLQLSLSNVTPGNILAVTPNSIQLKAALTTALSPGDILLMTGFANDANNKARTVLSFATDKITFTDATGAAETAPATAAIQDVGFQAATGDLSLAVNGLLYVVEGTGIGASLSGLKAGDWIYIDGLTGFTGYARLGADAAGDSLVLERVLGPFTAGAETTSTGRIYSSMTIRNPEKQEDMVYWSYQFEQTLGQDADGTQARYVKGAMANEFTLTVPSADKVTAQFAFVACDEETRTGAQGLVAGARPALETFPMFNASKSSNRVWLHKHGDADPLFTYATSATVTINNNMTGVKAIGVMGNLDINVGVFEVGGSVTAYFLDVRSIQAMRDNADISGTVALVGNNVGVVFDMPLMGLSNGQTAIEPNTPVTIALDMAAVRNDRGYTLQYSYFPFLPK